jgi:PAS domain S-box-containing protein
MGDGSMRKSRFYQRLDIKRFPRYLLNIQDSFPDHFFNLEQTRRVYIPRFTSIIVIITLISLGINVFIKGNYLLGVLDFVLASILFGNILHGVRYKQYAFNIYLGVSFAAMLFVYMFLTGGINNTGFVWYYTFPLGAFYLLGSKRGAVATVLILLPAIGLFLMKTPPPFFVNYTFDFKIRFISSFIVVFAVSYLFEYSREMNREELQRAHAELEKRVEERTSALQEAIQSLQKEISERRRVEEALRESEEKYRTILEDTQVGYFELDLAGNVTFVNDEACRRLGYPKEEFIGMNYRQYYADPEAAKQISQVYNELYRTGEPIRGLDREVIRKDGTKFIHELSISLIRDSEGKPIGFRGISRDITQRKKMEEALRTSEAQLSNALKIAHLGHWEYDVASDLFIFTNHFYAIFRTTAEREGGYIMSSAQYAQRFVHPDDRSVVGAEIQKALETTDPCYNRQLEHRMIYADGEVGYIAVRFFVIKDERGRTVKTYGVNQDITERKQMEEALRESENKFRDLAEKSLVGVYLIQDGIFKYVNARLAEINGHTAEELIDKKGPKDFIVPEDWPIVEENLRKRLSGEVESRHFEFRGITKDNRIINVEVYGSRTMYLGRPAIVGTLLDITERKQAEEALEKKTEELARSNRDLEQFAYIASHDLQEPLRMVTSYVQLLARRYKGKLGSDADDFINFAVDGVVRMWKLINDLLTYSRVGMRGIELKPTDCEAVLNHSLDNLKVAIEENGTLVTHDPLPTVMADNLQLGQLFQNMIGNAIKFRGKEPPRVHISASRNGNGWTISVRDNGIGIAPEHTERIFVIFQRLHSREKYAGTGIGLAICQKIVERHGGRIWVESEVGKGSTFYFTLPSSKAEPPSS